MPNELFRAQVVELFEKLVWPHSAMDVAAQAEALRRRGLAQQIRRGQRTVDTAQAIASGAGMVGKGLARAGSWLLRPAQSEGTALARELSSVVPKSALKPHNLMYGATALAAAPIFMNAFSDSRKKREEEIMNLEANPMRGFDKLSLDTFLEKKAQTRSHWMARFQGDAAKNVLEGLAKGVGSSVAGAAVGGVESLLKKLHTSLIVDPKRQKLFESVVRSDAVIHDAIERNPMAAKVLLEAFETMVRFAPSLTVDVNAVRSFLREAVVGGTSGVNYATIKSLIETEKALKSPGGKP